MRKHVKIIGPCSKWIEGEGWVTQIPEEVLNNANYHKVTEEQLVISKDVYEYLIECEQIIKRLKLCIDIFRPKRQNALDIIDPNAQSQDGLKCIHHECDMEGNHCTAGHGITFDRCVLPFDRSFCEYYKEEEQQSGKIQRRRLHRNNK